MARSAQHRHELPCRHIEAHVGERLDRLARCSAQSHQADQVVTQRLVSQQQSVSGVDANEELVKLMQFQRSFQAAAKYVSVVDQTLADLFQMM